MATNGRRDAEKVAFVCLHVCSALSRNTLTRAPNPRKLKYLPESYSPRLTTNLRTTGSHFVRSNIVEMSISACLFTRVRCIFVIRRANKSILTSPDEMYIKLNLCKKMTFLKHEITRNSMSIKLNRINIYTLQYFI